VSALSNIREIEPQQIWNGVVSRAVHGERVTLSLIELAPGTDVPEHSHDNEQVGILIQGSLTFRIGDEIGEVTPGGTWCILANVPHSVTAGPEGAVLSEVFSPPRHDWHALEKHEPGPGRWP
jgi:quercetin dioxygenase-like cupin family protein